jgi:lipopolysaccharide/colanic/teichoic acid biosynthesis glycosyltransferase
MTTYPVSKRIFDIAVSFSILAVSLPLWPVIALAILFEDGFPVFIRLERVSEGRVMRVIKFRSMVRGAHAMKESLAPQNERHDGPLFKMKNDPRLLKTGKFFRKVRVDELPQLLNVIAGSLALVGPRPHEPQEVAAYPENYAKVPLARAGATGLSQVMGASALSFERELEYDEWYLKHRSLWLDMKILWRTVAVFLFDPTGV